MGLSTSTRSSELRFASYVEALTAALGHADRAVPFRSYCTGLLLPGERKSVEPIAARVEPGRVQAAHQSLHHFVAKAEWSDEAVLAAVRARVLPIIEQRGGVRAWMIDDTAIPKKGTHSVGVARQYCGQLGKQDNCQVAITLSLAGDHASLPIAHRLYLPQAWADDPARRARAGVPEDVVFRTKPQIALDQIRAALEAGVPPGVLLADAGYGIDTAFRDGITELSLHYIVGIRSSTSLWPPGMAPLPPKTWSGRGRPPSLVGRDSENRPSPRAEEWFVIEWPADEPEPTKYWLSTLPADITRRAMIDLAKLRWRIERDYQDLKQELGFGQYEGRGWRGFHHHATLCIAAYGFLIAERGAFPPSAGNRPAPVKIPAIPENYRPRGAPDPT